MLQLTFINWKHTEITTVTTIRCESVVTPCLRYLINLFVVVATCLWWHPPVMFITAVKLGVLAWRSMEIDSLSEPQEAIRGTAASGTCVLIGCFSALEVAAWSSVSFWALLCVSTLRATRPIKLSLINVQQIPERVSDGDVWVRLT